MNQQAIEQVIDDLLLTRKELERRGWSSGWLMDLDDLPEHEIGTETIQNASVCMTGAVGAALEGVEFLTFAADHYGDVPVDWEWSPRGEQVIKALTIYRPAGLNLVHGQDMIHNIVTINDDQLHVKENALAWIDFAVAGLRAELPKDSTPPEPPKKKVVRETATAVQQQQETEVLA